MSYYLMHRGWMDNDVFRSAVFCERSAWIWLIENAAYQDTIVKIDRKPVEIRRGELSFSQRFLAEQWRWPKTKVHRFLEDLATWGMIEQRSSPTPKPDHQKDRPQAIIRLCNYTKYQDAMSIIGPSTGPKADHLRTIYGPNKKEGKESKKEEDSVANATAVVDPVKALWDRGKAVLREGNVPEIRIGSLIGKWRKEWGDTVVMIAIEAAEREASSNVVEFMIGCMRHAKQEINGHGHESKSGRWLRDSFQAIVDADESEAVARARGH